MIGNRLKQIAAALLAIALALGLCGCGQGESGAFRTLSVIGTRRYSVLCRKGDRLAPLLGGAMEGLAADGTLSALSVRWLGRDAITLKAQAAPGEDADGRPETAARTLIVGVEADHAPMACEEDGVLRGMSIDLADALGRALGWEVAYQPISADEVEMQLSSGNIDCALGFDPASVNAAKYNVGATYLESDVVLAVRPDSHVKRLRDLKEQRVGTVNDPALTGLVRADEQITRYASGATAYLSSGRCVNALDNGWCAAIVMDRVVLEHLQ